jgi:hypothetical protein
MDDEQNNAASQPVDTTQAPAAPPVVDSQAAQPVNSPVVPDKSKRKKLFAGIAAGLVAVAVVGGGMVFAMRQNSPEARLAKALDSFVNAKSIKTEGSLDIDTGDGQTITSKGINEFSLEPFAFNSRSEIDLLATRVVADIRFAGGNYFLKIGGLEGTSQLIEDQLGPEFAPPVNDAIAKLNDKWIEIQGSLAKEAGFDLEAIVAKLKENEAALDFDKDVVTIAENLGDEDINGTPTLHLKLSLNKEKTTEMLVALLNGVTVGDTALNADEIRKEINESFKDFDPNKDTFEVWIDKSTNQFKQMKFVLEMEGETQDAVVTFGDFNQQLNIEAPEDTMTLLEAYDIVLEAADKLGLNEAALEGIFQEALPTEAL